MATPILLQANTTYNFVYDTNFGDNVYLQTEVLPNSPDITFVKHIGDAWTGSFYPTSDNVHLGGYGNATFEGRSVTAVPEPATGTLLSVGCVGLGAYAWRRRNVKRA